MNSEFVPHEENKSKEVANFIIANEKLADISQRRDYFNQLSEDDFIDLLEQAASIVRTGDSTKRQHLDGDRVGLFFHEVPDQREKEELLRLTWQIAKSFLEDQNISDQDALDYAMLTVAGGILYAHPFADGNGRTARAITYMISNGSKNLENLDAILSETNGGGKWNIAPEPVYIESRREFSGYQPDKIKWGDFMAGEGTDALGGIIINSSFSEKIIRTFIENHSDEIRNVLEECRLESEDGNFILDGSKFISKLVKNPDSGMTDAKELIDLYRLARAERLIGFLNYMKSERPIEPNQDRLASNIDLSSPKLNMSERIRAGIVIARQEFEKRSKDGLILPRDRALILHKSSSL